MSRVVVMFAFAGIVLFAIRLATDPANWPTYAFGVAACVFVWIRYAKVIQFNRRVTSAPSLHEIQDRAALGDVLTSERAVVYKHSTGCPVSAIVIDEVLQFAEKHPSWPVHVVQVIEHRDLSDTVADRLGVRHESPQALVLRDGRCIWHTSHGGITAHQLGQHLT